MKNSIATLALIPAVLAFAPTKDNVVSLTALKASAIGATDKALYDPLGLYPASSPERMSGVIKPLETFSEPARAVTDPLGIYPKQSELFSATEMSASVPFLTRPAHLDGSLPGDRGFDPFNFAAAEEGSLEWYRKSELKHSRIAMLAAVGWPIAELFHSKIADSIGFPSLLASGDRVPSVLNDGLAHVPFAQFWIPVIALTAALELSETFSQDKEEEVLVTDVGKSGVSFVEEAEVFNGRLAMLAVTGFAIQEFLFQEAVVNQFPIFFKPINVALEQLMNSGPISL